MTSDTKMTTDSITATTTGASARARRAKTSATTASAAVPTAAMPAAPTKSDTVIKLLLRARGATPMELIAATDWQAHSLRAFLSGLRKKGRVIVREARKTGEFAYRIEAAPPVTVVPGTPTATDTPASSTADTAPSSSADA